MVFLSGVRLPVQSMAHQNLSSSIHVTTPRNVTSLPVDIAITCHVAIRASPLLDYEYQHECGYEFMCVS